jgi:hypothetical protein
MLDYSSSTEEIIMPTPKKDAEEKTPDPALTDVEPGSDADATPVAEPSKTPPDHNKKPDK